MKKTTERRRFTPDFKANAVKLAEKIGAGPAGEKLGIHVNNLHRWKAKKSLSSYWCSPSGYFKSLKKHSTNLDLRGETVQSAFRIHKGLYGYRKVSHHLTNTGISCSVDQARYIMNQRGLKARSAPYLLSNKDRDRTKRMLRL